MDLPGLRLSLCVLCGLWLLPAHASQPLVGGYTHTHAEPDESPVWNITHDGNHYDAQTVADGEHVQAWLLSERGRAAFWERMSWPVASSATAVCLSWGTAPLTLQALLEPETTPEPPGEDRVGASVLCQVQAADKARLDWLAGYQSDYFYYDPLFGVTESRALP